MSGRPPRKGPPGRPGGQCPGLHTGPPPPHPCGRPFIDSTVAASTGLFSSSPGVSPRLREPPSPEGGGPLGHLKGREHSRFLKRGHLRPRLLPSQGMAFHHRRHRPLARLARRRPAHRLLLTDPGSPRPASPASPCVSSWRARPACPRSLSGWMHPASGLARQAPLSFQPRAASARLAPSTGPLARSPRADRSRTSRPHARGPHRPARPRPRGTLDAVLKAHTRFAPGDPRACPTLASAPTRAPSAPWAQRGRDPWASPARTPSAASTAC
ncbi:hypothetical protein SAMN05443639_10212 [Stigmatella erecta]|uniref:Uncharacterized protein n=1 Tax=Stigmatella erecta TaxID=83460 RepID=A0A1I0C7Z0_9BACT|nr:hypothetical protein SAMN05443639_10212 [Stigmatella erecta]